MMSQQVLPSGLEVAVVVAAPCQWMSDVPLAMPLPPAVLAVSLAAVATMSPVMLEVLPPLSLAAAASMVEWACCLHCSVAVVLVAVVVKLLPSLSASMVEWACCLHCSMVCLHCCLLPRRCNLTILLGRWNLTKKTAPLHA